MIKIFLMGQTVGKTSLVNRLVGNEILSKEPTLELEMSTTKVKGQEVIIWDSPKNSDLSVRELESATVILLLYDCTDRDSFKYI